MGTINIYVPRQFVLVCWSFLCLIGASDGFSTSYLNTLAIGNTPDDRPPGPESIVPEEYYGFMNPMANNWPGSKHEQYGGYLRNLKVNSNNPIGGSSGSRGSSGGVGRFTDTGGSTSTTSTSTTKKNNNNVGYLESLTLVQSSQPTYAMNKFE